jgi:ribosomal protein S18 acetylase RimI-like enzyme
MEHKIIELNEKQVNCIEKELESYDEVFMPDSKNDSIQIGIEMDEDIVAGLDATMTSFRIMYVSTLFVKAKYRRMGIGKILIDEMESRAKELGANTIRLDTFSWQGKEFYEALGYQIVGSYRNEEDDYEEYFFMKRI